MSGVGQTPKIKYIANLAAWSLIIASGGFGVIYGWTVSIHHGNLMAWFTVLFVIALEILKPLSIAYCFQCFQQLQLIRGLLLAILGLTAIAYSLTAELSLMYAAKSDHAAQRKSETFSATASQQHYESALQQLKSLPRTRASVAEVESDVATLKAKYRNFDFDCQYIEDKIGKVACPQMAKLNAEIGIIQKREKLQASIDKFLDKTPEKNVEKLADPGSAAIQTYLKIFGTTLDQGTISQFVVLIPIFALELGSALGLLLVSAISETAKSSVRHDETPTIQPGRAARKAIMRQLQEKGEADISQRQLAKREGLDKSTIQRAMRELEQEGVIDRHTDKTGTKIRLVK